MKLLTVFLALILLCGCCVSANAEEEDTLPPMTQYLTDELYAEADKWPSCDDRALAAVMRKAQAGETVTVAVLGGSITEGTISKGDQDRSVPTRYAYADIFKRWWTQRFPKTRILFVNAGIGGTDSYLGLHRLWQDVMRHEPDVLLVEYAVNDDGKKFYQVSYDNLVRRALQADKMPAVMLLFMGQTNGATAQTNQVPVGFKYQLPMVSYINVINAMMKSGMYTAQALSGDTVHPSRLGHAVTGEILWRYLNDVYARRNELGDPDPFTLHAVTRDKYMNPCILSGDSLTPESLGTFTAGTSATCRQYPKGWINKSGAGELTAVMTFRNLGLLYQRTIDGQSGRYEVLIDGEAVMTVDGNFPGGWGNAITATEVYTSDAAAEHTVTIRQAEGSDGKLILLGFMTSD